MAIAFDAVSSQTSTAQPASLTWAHTVSGSDRYLFVSVNLTSGTVGNVTGVTYNGVAMSAVWNTNASQHRITGWELIAPDTGTHNIVASFSGVNDEISAGAMSFTGVDQTTPRGTPATANGNSGTATVNVSSASGELVIDGVSVVSSAPTVGAGQTQRYNVNAGGFNHSGGSHEAGAGTVTMSWTFSSSAWRIGAVALKPAGAGGVDFSGTLAAASSTAAGVESQIVGLSGTLAAQSAAFSSTLSVINAFSGTLTSQSATTTSALSIIVSLSGSLSGSSSSVAGVLSIIAGLSGTLATASASMSGVLNIIASLSGTLAAASASAAGALSVIGGFSGTLAVAASTIAGAFSVASGADRDFNGALSAQSATMAGTASIIVGLSGTAAAGSSSISSTVSILVGLSGTLSSPASQIVGAFATIVALEFSGALFADPSRLDLEWLIRLGDSGTGWRKDRRGFHMSLGKRR